MRANRRNSRPSRCCALLGFVLIAHGTGGHAHAQGFVQALSEIRPWPATLRDARRPLSERIALARSLGRYGVAGDAVPTLLEALREKPEPALREELLLSLARRADASAAPALVALLEHDDAPSAALCTALSAIGTRETLAALTSALAKPKAAAVAERALLDAGPKAAVPLANAVRSVLALRATQLIGRLGASAAQYALPSLIDALKSESPELRAAAAEALGQLGDPRGASPLLERLSDPSPRVVTAALVALARLATPASAPVLSRYLEHAPAGARPLALKALAQADPERAVTALGQALGSPDSALRAAAVQTLEGAAPHPSFVPLLSRVFDAELREATASALARVASGSGVSALLASAERSPDAAQHAARAIAIALRRFADVLPSDQVRRGHRLLRSLAPSERRVFLRALARDATVEDEAKAALKASSATERATAAAALGLLGDLDAGDALLAALAIERDNDAKRSMLTAAEALHAKVPDSAMQRLLDDPETAPEALSLYGAYAANAEADAPSHALRVLLRHVLASRQAPRARAAAALALGRLAERTARPALEAALSDASSRLRLAAVRALSALGGLKIASTLAAHARLERDPLVRRAALEAAAHDGVPARILEHGPLALELRAHGEEGGGEERPRLEVLLEDGRWLKLRALPGGELVIADLPEGQAEVRPVD